MDAVGNFRWDKKGSAGDDIGRTYRTMGDCLRAKKADRVRVDVSDCQKESGYATAKVTFRPDGGFSWTGDDPQAGARLTTCLRELGYTIR